jgi:hypothetical protein
MDALRKSVEPQGERKTVKRTLRPEPWDEGAYPWSLHRVPETIRVNDVEVPHPAHTSAIFVVHGMGQPKWAQTAAALRSGFEDVEERIERWQKGHPAPPGTDEIDLSPIPTPYILDGYWGDYADLSRTFPKDWALFDEEERGYFDQVWKLRTVSKGRTYAWFLWQQLRLLHPRVLREVGPLAYLIYVPLQVVSAATLTLAFFRHPIVLTKYLGDVRLYLDPRGLVERAIVQNVEFRVGRAFLKLIGLDWDFRALPEDQRIEEAGRRIVFERVVWVAHSLGTVISYNVLASLFERAKDLEDHGDEAQRRGVRRFREALRRFVTLGSPLDKVAFLFGGRSLRRWPAGTRRSALVGGETLHDGDPPQEREWWVNFYHVLDPVSGALSSRCICGDQPPANIHIGFLRAPGFAHVAYWKDSLVLRFVLARTYGRRFLRDREYRPRSVVVLALFAVVSYVVWFVLVTGAALYVVWWLWRVATGSL